MATQLPLEVTVAGEFERLPYRPNFFEVNDQLIVPAEDARRFMEFPSGKVVWEAPNRVFYDILVQGKTPLVFKRITEGDRTASASALDARGFDDIYIFGSDRLYGHNFPLVGGVVSAFLLGDDLFVIDGKSDRIIARDGSTYASLKFHVAPCPNGEPVVIDGQPALFDNSRKWYALERTGNEPLQRVVREFSEDVWPEVIELYPGCRPYAIDQGTGSPVRRLMQTKDELFFFDLDTGEKLAQLPVPVDDVVFQYRNQFVVAESIHNRTGNFYNIENGRLAFKEPGKNGMRIFRVFGYDLIADSVRSPVGTQTFSVVGSKKTAITFPEKVYPYLYKYKRKIFAFSLKGPKFYEVSPRK